MNVSLVSLWLPVILSSVVVFIVSSLIWAVVQYHNSDWQKLPDEEAARAAIRGASPGQYGLPYAASNAERNKPEYQERFKEGPAAMIYVVAHGTLSMNKQLIQWFIYCLAVSILVAYVTSVALTSGADYLHVFRISGTVAVLTYAGAAPMRAIWFGQTWTSSIKDVVDGLIYGLLTAGVFGWLWP